MIHLNKAIISIRKRFIWAYSYIILLYLRPLFVSNNTKLKQLLKKYDFHPAIANNPASLFYYYKAKHQTKRPLLFVKSLYTIFNNGYLTGPKGKKILHKVKISDYWAKYTPNITNLQGKFKLYKIAEPDNKAKIAVYTVITGNYDTVHEPNYFDDYTDYLLFTNNKNITSQHWKIIYIDDDSENVLLSRKIKMLPHLYLPKQYNYSVYIDANATIYGPLRELTFPLNSNNAFVVTKHNVRNSVSSELNACIEYGIIKNADEAKKQFNGYIDKGYQDDLGLSENTILVRSHNDTELIHLMECWWAEFQKAIRRDQLLLMPCIYFNKFTRYKLIDGFVFDNQYCSRVNHNQIQQCN